MRPKSLETNWRRGIRYERTHLAKLREMGWLCIRSAGSRGIVDGVAIHKGMKVIELIQFKAGLENMSEKEKSAILEPLRELEGEYIVKAVLK